MAVNANPNVGQKQKKQRLKSSSRSSTAAAPNNKKGAYTEKRIQTEKPSAKAPMLASDFDESGLLKGLDLEMGTEEILTLSGVTAEAIGEDEKLKPVLSFKEIDKRLVLNKTNRTVLVEALGNDMTRWPNHRVAVFPMMVQFKDKMVQAVRLRMPGPKGGGSRGGLRRKV